MWALFLGTCMPYPIPFFTFFFFSSPESRALFLLSFVIGFLWWSRAGFWVSNIAHVWRRGQWRQLLLWLDHCAGEGAVWMSALVKGLYMSKWMRCPCLYAQKVLLCFCFRSFVKSEVKISTRTYASFAFKEKKKKRASTPLFLSLVLTNFFGNVLKVYIII